MTKHIEWKYLIGLHQLYIDSRTKLKIMNNNYINCVLFNQKKLIKYKMGNHSIIEATERYSEFYQKEFLDTYNYYNTFFLKSGIENNAKKSFTEEDLKALMFIFYNKEELKKKSDYPKKVFCSGI